MLAVYYFGAVLGGRKKLEQAEISILASVKEPVDSAKGFLCN